MIKGRALISAGMLGVGAAAVVAMLQTVAEAQPSIQAAPPPAQSTPARQVPGQAGPVQQQPGLAGGYVIAAAPPGVGAPMAGDGGARDVPVRDV